MIVGFEGPAAQVDAAVAAAAPLVAQGRDLGARPGEYWHAHRHDVSYKLAPIFAGGGWADTMEVAAPWSRLHALHDGVRRAIGARAVVMAHFSHA
ncbi:MAG: FAD-linked oxidase C-terminal domain-containing protein, partial [Myxococcota bacterium]|nr:FAD-linked oxidase C-terminal domain-containing protein [Myxococcota bacterium]